MKTPKFLKFLSPLVLITFLMAGFSSCSKDDTGALTVAASANVMIVNAGEGSTPQDFYADGVKVTSSTVAYGTNSSYISTPSGLRKGEFRASGATSATASQSLTFQAGKNYTVYLTGDARAYSSFASEDDMTAPPSGKAKVRFVHLSTALTSALDFGITGGSKIVTSLAYQTTSLYQTVDANTGFTLYLAGSSTASLTIPGTVQAGKIYTVYISGSTTATLTYRVILQN